MADLVLVLATSTGGVGKHVHSLEQGLRAAGWDVRVACPSSTQAVFGFAGHVPLELGSRPHPVRDAAAVRTLRGLRADVVHAHGIRAGSLAVLGPAPTVVTWHNAQTGGRLGTVLERLVGRRADVTLAVSPDLAARARQVGARDVRLAQVAAPALPPLTGRDVRAELGALDRPLVLAVGRLHPQKGLDVLVDAVSDMGDVVVAVAGEGPLRADLESRAAGLPVRFLGRRSDLADLYAAADVVVLPSRWEGRPLTAMEVLRAGRPLVTTPVGGVPLLVEDGAVLVQAENAGALAAAVRRLLDDPAAATALAARGAEISATWPDEADVVAQVSALCSELLR